MKTGLKIIYKVTNKQTNEVYIGATTKSIEERKVDHIQKSNKKIGSYFQEAIGTYGLDAFSWEQIDIASDNNDLASKEIKYISEYNSIKNGYNSDKGGGFTKNVYQYKLDGTLNQTFEGLSFASKIMSVRKQDISRACGSVNNMLGGFLWSYEYREPFVPKSDNRKKEVIQYNVNGSVLARYVSASEASRITGISKTCITRCCREERESSGGFLWKYIL